MEHLRKGEPLRPLCPVGITGPVSGQKGPGIKLAHLQYRGVTMASRPHDKQPQSQARHDESLCRHRRSGEISVADSSREATERRHQGGPGTSGVRPLNNWEADGILAEPREPDGSLEAAKRRNTYDQGLSDKAPKGLCAESLVVFGGRRWWYEMCLAGADGLLLMKAGPAIQGLFSILLQTNIQSLLAASLGS